MKVGFDISDRETEQQEEQGFAETQPVLADEHWTADLGDFIFRNLMGFSMVYGFYAAIRDLIKSVL